VIHVEHGRPDRGPCLRPGRRRASARGVGHLGVEHRGVAVDRGRGDGDVVDAVLAVDLQGAGDRRVDLGGEVLLALDVRADADLLLELVLDLRLDAVGVDRAGAAGAQRQGEDGGGGDTQGGAAEG
jgi:hypothetical protein